MSNPLDPCFTNSESILSDHSNYVFEIRFFASIGLFTLVNDDYLKRKIGPQRLSYRYTLSKNTSKPVEVTYAVLLILR